MKKINFAFLCVFLMSWWLLFLVYKERKREYQPHRRQARGRERERERGRNTQSNTKNAPPNTNAFDETLVSVWRSQVFFPSCHFKKWVIFRVTQKREKIIRYISFGLTKSDTRVRVHESLWTERERKHTYCEIKQKRRGKLQQDSNVSPRKIVLTRSQKNNIFLSLCVLN